MNLVDAASPSRAARNAPVAPLKLRGIVKPFGDKKALRGLDLDVAAGQFVAIIGRSGCGKSTLLRLIAGFDAPDAGAIDFEGGAAAVPRVMFQEPRLLPWANVIANVEVGLGARRREGFTALLVTHDVAEAVTLADRIVLLEDGAVALDLEVALPRRRLRGSPDFGRLEETILDRLLGPSRSA